MKQEEEEEEESERDTEVDDGIEGCSRVTIGSSGSVSLLFISRGDAGCSSLVTNLKCYSRELYFVSSSN